MATVAYQEKEVLVPLTEGWLLEVDEAAKIVRMDLPEGLLDI